jgi:hypothetical protein
VPPESAARPGTLADRDAPTTDPIVGRAHAVVLYASALFVATFVVLRSGDVEMVEDKAVDGSQMLGLPVFRFVVESTATGQLSMFVRRRTPARVFVRDLMEFVAAHPGARVENVYVEDDLVFPIGGGERRERAGTARAPHEHDGSRDWDCDLLLEFLDCVFFGDVRFDEARIRRSVSFRDCRVLGRVSGRNAHFDANFEMRSSHVFGVERGGDPEAPTYEVLGSAYERRRFVTEVFDLRGAFVDGDLDLLSTRMDGSVVLARAHVTGRVNLRGVRIMPLIASLDELDLPAEQFEWPPGAAAEPAPGRAKDATAAAGDEAAAPRYLGAAAASHNELEGAILDASMLIADADVDLGAAETADDPRKDWVHTLVAGSVSLKGARIAGDLGLGGLVVTTFDPGHVFLAGQVRSRADGRRRASRYPIWRWRPQLGAQQISVGGSSVGRRYGFPKATRLVLLGGAEFDGGSFGGPVRLGGVVVSADLSFAFANFQSWMDFGSAGWERVESIPDVFTDHPYCLGRRREDWDDAFRWTERDLSGDQSRPTLRRLLDETFDPEGAARAVTWIGRSLQLVGTSTHSALVFSGAQVGGGIALGAARAAWVRGDVVFFESGDGERLETLPTRARDVHGHPGRRGRRESGPRAPSGQDRRNAAPRHR